MTEITREEALEHFGIRGMKWGVRRESQSEGDSHGLSSNQKKAIAIGAGAAILAGAAATGYILNRNGNVPMHTLLKGSTSMFVGKGSIMGKAPKPMFVGKGSIMGKAPKPMFVGKGSIMGKGAKIADQIIHKNANVMLKDIMDAHANQSKYMRSIVPYYNPRKNPFTPEARSLLKLGS